MSLKTKAVITSTPASSQPCGKQTSAPAQTPSVPTRVTVLGLTPELEQEVAHGRPDVGPELAEAFEHGGSRVATEPRFLDSALPHGETPNYVRHA